MTTRMKTLRALTTGGLLFTLPAAAGNELDAFKNAFGQAAQAGSAAANALTGKEAENVKRAYDAYDGAKYCPEGRNCGRGLREAAGVSPLPHGPYDPVKMFNPRAGMPNPDPEWLIGWDALPTGSGSNDGDKVFTVMANAAAVKQARSACLKAFAAQLYPQFTAADAKVGQAIDAALASGGTHDQVAALVALRKAPEARSPAGARFRLEQELAKLISTPALQVAWRADHLDQGADAAKLRPTLPQDVEATLYCAGRLANVREEGVRRPFTDEEIAAARKAEAAAATYQGPAESTGYSSLTLADHTDFKAPFIISGEVTVTSATPAKVGGGTVVEAELKREEQMLLGCKQSKERMIIENGKMQYDKDCTYGSRAVISTVKLNLTDLPRGGLQKGDALRLTVGVKEFKSKTTRHSPAKETVAQTFVADSAALSKVSRAGAVVFTLSP